jgi:hypothetical protein
MLIERLTTALLAFLLLLSASLASADHIRPLPYDSGGSVVERAVSIMGWKGQHRITGYCSSACTMALGYRNVCIHLPATLGFHQVDRDYTGIAQPLYEDFLPTKVRRWYRAHADNSSTIVRVTGREAIERGWVRECGD